MIEDENYEVIEMTLKEFVEAHKRFFWKPRKHIAGGIIRNSELLKLKKISIYEMQEAK